MKAKYGGKFYNPKANLPIYSEKDRDACNSQ